jgi:hypothetical protein
MPAAEFLGHFQPPTTAVQYRSETFVLTSEYFNVYLVMYEDARNISFSMNTKMLQHLR